MTTEISPNAGIRMMLHRFQSLDPGACTTASWVGEDYVDGKRTLNGEPLPMMPRRVLDLIVRGQIKKAKALLEGTQGIQLNAIKATHPQFAGKVITADDLTVKDAE